LSSFCSFFFLLLVSNENSLFVITPLLTLASPHYLILIPSCSSLSHDRSKASSKSSSSHRAI
jgi:hypothetical protein